MKLFYPANKLLVSLTVILCIFSDSLHSQTPLSFTAIPFSDPDLNAPGRGVEQWHNANEVNVPAAGTSTPRLDKYYRFSWAQFETTQGNYTWTVFDGQINSAISNGQKFSFGVMTSCPGCEGGWIASYGGASSAYPQYLHNLMQAESVKDWNSGGNWVPNYNSESYLSRLLALNQAIYNHIQNTSYNGVRYRDVVSIIDIRGYGSWGEWHSGSTVNNNVNEYPAGTFPTVASLKRIVDAHTQGFPDIPLVAMIAAFDANYLGIVMNPPEIGYYILTTKNNWGPIGWRRDQWGATDSYLESYLVNNTRSFNGVPLNSLIMERWKTSPITGEPPGWATDYNILESQVRLYHAASFGNGNYGGADPNSIGNNIRASSKAAGYRLVLEGGSLNSSITTGTPTPVTLNWKNVGIAPTYENWDVTFELKNSGGTIVWSGKSAFKLKLFLPQTTSTAVTDNLTIPTSVAAGTYSLNLIVKDPNGYRKPLPLAIKGVNADGSYTLRSVTVSSGTGQTNNPPVANAGADRAITLPTNSASLTGSGTDADGSIANYLWVQVSGPSSSTLSATNTANITVSNLQSGTYTYRLTVTDDDGATDNDEVIVTVGNSIANQAPIANAGANKTITLPTNSTTLSGSGSSDPDGTIASYQWQQVSGPSTSTLSAANTVNVTVSNLQAGTYTYRLTVTDNSDASDNVTVVVTVNNAPVNQAPVANAGANRTITLPTSSASLAGSGTDADGTISGYQWLQVIGPSTSTLSATNTASITVSNLQAGVYTYRLTVTDNGTATGTDEVTVTVNGAPNQAPVAAAGANRTITLPTSSTTLSGGGSSDADGTIASYRWQQVSGPSASTLSATNTANITISNLQAGSYTYRVTVTDNNGATDTDDVTVTVNSTPNQGPSANAGANKSITLPANSTTLNGTGADPDGTIAAYQWQQVSGPAASGLSATNIANITISNLQAGIYTYRLTVRDNAGAISTDDVSVTVNPAPNQAPVANAGTNKFITLPTSSTTLTGSGTDADGTLAAYLWQQVSGPSASTLSATNTSGITVSNLQAGVYTYRLTVTDDDGATDIDDLTVTVNAAQNQAPVANAGINKSITLPTTSTSLSGSGTDADGTIASYVWQQVNGPSASTLSAANTAGITISNLQAGIYTYRLTVTDNDGTADTDDVTVTVSNAPVNQAPNANAGANLTITLPTSSTNLSGSGTDPDGTIASYQWQQLSGPSASTLSATNTAGITVSNLQAGVYTYRLTVTDNAGGTDTDDVTVTVNNAPANQAPNANAGPNRSITLPANSTTLNGSGNDADGTIASYLWQQVSGPSASTLSATNTAGITVSNLQAGEYSYRLTVTDNDGATDVDLVNVTVNNAAKKAPNANAGTNKSINSPAKSTSLSGTSSTDEDGTIVSYQWQQVSGPSASSLSSSNSANTNVDNLEPGVYTYRLTVTDNDNTSDADLVTVTVNAPPNQAPIANAGANRVITLPTNSTSLNGSTSADADGTIARYQWQQVSGPSSSALSAANTATITVSNLVTGAYTFRLTVTDNDNATATDEVTVTVNNQPNEAPIANAGTNLIITLPTNSASLSGSGIDADGTIAGYQWQQISGPSGSALSATNTANITVTNLQAGVYIYRLTVRDDDNATGTDNVTITVNIAPPNQAPVADAGANKAITLPTNTASLSGSASTDPDGTIAGYLWQQVGGPSPSTLSATNTANITVSNLQAGVYTYRLTVRDNDNATSVATVTVTVNALANALPIADAGTDQTIVVTANTTTLSAERSIDPDGVITNYTWQQVSGPGASVFSATSGKTVDVSNLLVGEYTYRVTIRDNKNATATAIVKVTVIDNFRNYTNSVVVYPNPATEVINLRLLNDKPGRVQVNIYDMSGKVVLSPLMVNKPAGAYSVPVIVSVLKPGTYVVQITTFGYKKIAATFIKL